MPTLPTSSSRPRISCPVVAPPPLDDPQRDVAVRRQRPAHDQGAQEKGGGRGPVCHSKHCRQGRRGRPRCVFARRRRPLHRPPLPRPLLRHVGQQRLRHRLRAPFVNYWTCEGGLPEVISVLPDKGQADVLLVRYFECVDPVYSMIHRQTFYADYEHFWQLGAQERDETDAAFIGLIFVMLALGTQFVASNSAKERKQTAKFYASASNQALRMSSYLSTASLHSIQAMVLVTYFLINDNHASDGWAFAGILIRQAYAMGLHRDPNIGRLPAPSLEAKNMLTAGTTVGQ